MQDLQTTSTAFTSFQSTKQLALLAHEPFDLTADSALTKERIDKYVATACGYTLLYGTERVNDQVMQSLYSLAEEANVLDKMHQMQSGVVINEIEGYPSDKRPVLHTAMRSLFGIVQEGTKDAVDLAKREHQKLKHFLQEIEGRFDTMIVIGIGGSNLGPEAMYKALQYLEKPDRTVHFVSNIDPDDLASVVEKVDLSRSLGVIVSKSGTTLETRANEAFLHQCFTSNGLDPKEHLITVTGENSPLDDLDKYLQCFYAWDFVGGRFSTTALYGGVSLSFGLGYDTFLEFLKGAHEMDQCALGKENNLPLLLALLGIWNHNFLGYSTGAIVPYSHALRRFPAHIQQLDMESNGKEIDRLGHRVDFETGPIIWGEPGTNAQHSFFQMIHQGTSIVPLELIAFCSSQKESDLKLKGTTNQEKLVANCIAQAISLAQGHDDPNPNKRFEGNRPSLILMAKKLTPYNMGSLFSLYEHKIAFQGFIWGINSFDQEGVQLGKVLADRVLSSMQEENFPLADAYLKHLGRC